MKTRTQALAQTVAGLSLLATLVACGSGINSTSSATNGTGGATSGAALVELGSGVGTNFQNGVLDIQVAKLSAGGTTGVTANIVDGNSANALYNQSVTVNFTSKCVSSGTASIDSSVTTTNGTASATYVAAGCSGSDTITATALVGSITLTATGTLTVQPASLGSLIFVAPADPTEIGLAGMGGVTSSKITFKLLDTNGNPVPDVLMSFSTDTLVGGVTVFPLSTKTLADGTASTFIQAGTAHTVVHVTATATSNGVTKSGGSTGVTISTGVATEDNFTLVSSTHNVEGANVFLGTAVTAVLTVGLGDRYANPVPDGTQVSFTTNGGNIDNHCTTNTVSGVGQCTATWVSTTHIPNTGNGGIQGHAHILAYTTGEEHFTDTNNDGVFDDGDTFTPFAGNTHNPADYFFGVGTPPQDDIGNPYADWNEDQSYTSSPGETFATASTNTVRHAPDGKWYGVSCGGLGSTAANVLAKNDRGNPATVQCGGTTIAIGKEECIVMGTSTYFAMDPLVVNATIGNTATPQTQSVGSGVTLTYYIVDSNGDVPAEGTLITLDTSGLVGATATFPGGGASLNVPDLPGACLTGSKGSIPSSGNAAPYKGFPITILLKIPASSTTAAGGNFSISMKTPVTTVNEVGITVTVIP